LNNVLIIYGRRT